MPVIRLWVHAVWSTKNRERVLGPEVRMKLFDHITVEAGKKNIHIDTIGGYTDHVHAIIGLGPDQCIARVMQQVKGESSHWINTNRVLRGHFEWQTEYYAASFDVDALDRVRAYVNNQEEHHRYKTFAEEYEEFIKKYGAMFGVGG
jgi:putative transposase